MKTFLATAFYIMSPFFPGNNWLEIAMIGALAGYISPLMPGTIDIGLLRSILYFIYNLIAIIGLAVCARHHLQFSLRTIVEVALALAILFATGFTPEPWGTALLTICGIYFIYPHLQEGWRRLKKATQFGR